MSDWKNVQYKDGKYKTDDSGGGGSSTFSGLEDVSLTNLQNGQVPKYNSTTQKWENADESGGGGSGGGGVTFEVVTDNGSYDNGTTVTLTLTKKYSSPYPFPVNCLPLTNWNNGARVVVKTNTISYSEQSNQLQFEIYVSSTESYTCDWMVVDMINHGDIFKAGDIYSTEEREIGVWIDGKPLYSKVIRNTDGSALPQLNDVTDLHIDKLIRAEGLISDHSDRTYPRGLITTTSGLGSREIYMPDANTVRRNGDSFSCFEIILYYTKTTDTPGSGSWAQTGLPAHHYSENEQVIGTWIDGKPLYEQSIVYTNSSGLSSGSTTLETIATGLNMIPGGIRSIIYNTDGRQYPFPYAKTDGGSQIYYNKTSGDVIFLGQNDSWGTGWNKLYIVLQYTKDSDT